ncbi:efflux RND transporter periplasmic adaptor subunit [Anaeromyxobacter oryzae]|uniref:RND transporter n=1 Tax=Anaeromyxobacter oryzae TaxID=2918170 RepID=A0ABN6MR95_9BACT|nr:efflux RND transporter periplasmic adaptor subunit [Anaeromyxobacter oryzae]BDG02238.1 RND transporter [Anaeromyxobacter oryzae]
MTSSLSTLTALALVLAAPLQARAEGADPVPAPARVRAVRPGAAGGGALVPASVVSVRRATLATRVAATVRAVNVREGERVREGQVLVSLSDDDVRGALGAAESALFAASAHERRIRTLAAARAATPSELEQAGAQRSQAEAAVASARATLAYTQVRAPFDGTVQARRVEPGDLVGPGQPMLELEGKALELVASLSEAEARGVAVGSALPFQAGAVRGEAVVTALTPGGDPVSHRRGLRAQVRKADGELRSGDFARLVLPVGEGGGAATWLPRTALVERGDLTGVFVASGGRAELRWISVGEQAGDAVAVRAGLAPGDVVVDAPGALRDGQPVEVLP